MMGHSIQALLIEDNLGDARLLQEYLADVDSVAIDLVHVSSLQQGLQHLKAPFDVILLDLSLPDSYGLETLTKAQTAAVQVPIVVLTGTDDEELALRAMQNGAQDYLVKGQFTGDLLVRSMRYAIERKRAEEKIREQAALIDIAADAIIVQDLEHRVLFWNKGAERLYGWQAQDAIGRTVDQLIYPSTSTQYKAIKQHLLQENTWQGEIEHVRKDQQKVMVASRWTLVRDPQDIPRSMLVVNTDITEKKMLETQFLRAQRLESVGTLAGGIAHDLNNVLAPILMSAQLLRRKVGDEQGLHWLDTIETSAKRGANLVKQVLSFTKGMDGERTALQIGYLIREVEKIARETFPKSIEITIDDGLRDLWPLLGDATQLHQVLMNLCVNARDAMPQGGKMTIAARNLWIDQNYTRTHLDAHSGPYVEITVADTGVGIVPDAVDRIFEPFFTTKPLGKGTGLGLSTALGIVKNHGGFINVYSELDRGTEFKVCLPAIQSQATHRAHEQRQQLPIGAGELVLIVDDEAAICDMTQTALEQHNYRVLTAQNGIEAIALYAQHRADIQVTLVDMMMPTMDGATTIRTLHQMNPQAKIIAVSGLASNQQVAQSTGAHFQAFLSKPFTTEILLTTLHDVIRTPA